MNRSVAGTYGTTGTRLVDDTSTTPETPDVHEAVRAWFDLPATPVIEAG